LYDDAKTTPLYIYCLEIGVKCYTTKIFDGFA